MLRTCIVIGLLLIGTAAEAATVKHFASKDGREIVSLEGEIVPGDSDQFIAAVKAANNAGREVSGVRLNSPGGNLAEGAKLADAVRQAKIATVVVNGTTCASACFVAFAAGLEKFVSYGAQVGVHGASSGSGQETTESRAATIAMAKLVKELGVPPGIMGKWS